MKNITSIALFLFVALAARGQYSASGVKSDGFDVYKGAGKMYVMLSGDGVADNKLKDAISKNWSLRPVTYISSAEVEEKIGDKSACFMFPFEIDNGKGQYYHFFGILPGGKKKLSKYGYDDVLAYCPIDKYMTEPNFQDASFRYSVMVKNLQNVMEKVEKSNMSGNQFSLGKEFNEQNNKNLKKIKTKTLLVNADLGLDEKEIKEVYKYKFELCSKAKIDEAISKKDPNYVVFQPAITLNKFIFIFDCESYNCIYSSTSMMGMKVKQKDFKEIIEQLKG
jgi:hypothetical protein